MEANKEAVDGYIEGTQDIAETEEANSQERRQYKRRAARWNVKITTQKKEVVQCRTYDVSERGLSFKSPYDFNKMALIIAEIEVRYKQKKKVMRLLGQTRHSMVAGDGFMIGVLIKDAPDSVIDFLRKYANNVI